MRKYLAYCITRVHIVFKEYLHYLSNSTVLKETRHIMAAIMQHITYNEYLPPVLGEEGLLKHHVNLNSQETIINDK